MSDDNIKVLEATPVRSFLRSISAEELRSISPEEFLIDNFLPSGPRVCLLIGNSNVGKSFLALDIQNSLVCGFREWHGKKINRHGAVLYLTAEGETSVPKRLLAWLQDKRIPLSEIEGKFDILDTDTMLGNGDNLTFAPNETFREFLRSIRESGKEYVLAVVDTLSLFKEGEENSADDMAVFVNALKELASTINAPVLCLHHSLKYSETTFRGSSALRNNVDNLYILTETENGQNTICLVTDKSRDGEKGPETAMYFSKRKVFIEGLYSASGKQLTSLVLDSVEYTPTQQRSQKAIEDFELLDNLLCKELEPENIGENYGFTRDALTDALKKHYETEGNTPGEAKRKANRNSNPSGDSLAARSIREGFISWDANIHKFVISRNIEGLIWGWFILRNKKNKTEHVSECSSFQEN